MSYLGLETVKPIKPMKRGDLYSFPITTIDQIVTDEETNERLTEYLDNLIGMDLLWENASPTSSFAAQSFNIANLSKHEEFEMLYKSAVDNANLYSVHFRKKDLNNGQIALYGVSYYQGVFILERRITFDFANNKITFGDGLSNGNANNTLVIPLALQGK